MTAAAQEEASSVHIAIVLPVMYSEGLFEKAKQEYDNAASPGIELSYACLEHGTHTIESDFDMALAQPDTIRLCRKAEQDGAHAAVITCFGDPGGVAAKETTNIPIVGEGEAALHVAGLLAPRFSIVTVRQSTVPFMIGVAERVGLGPRLRSVRAVEAGVMDFTREHIDEVVEQAAVAVVDDGAEAIVMGCTGVGADMCPTIEERLTERVGSYVPVVDPVRCAISVAELCVRHGYRPSKRAYPTPPEERPEYRWAADLRS
jgi:allantoin racemase